eukprot:4091234-Prymnesium_polylepis.2
MQPGLDSSLRRATSGYRLERPPAMLPRARQPEGKDHVTQQGQRSRSLRDTSCNNYVPAVIAEAAHSMCSRLWGPDSLSCSIHPSLRDQVCAR